LRAAPFEGASFTSFDTAAGTTIVLDAAHRRDRERAPGRSAPPRAKMRTMCGRYTLANPDPKKLAHRFGVDDRELEFDERPRFNIAPTDSVLAVRGDERGRRQFGKLRWGLAPGHWALGRSGRPLINARAETIATQPAYRESFHHRRCLIPADGFYEWQRRQTGKQPIWIARGDEEPFAFAGIWAELDRKEGTLLSCAIATCPPNELMRPIHDRMPVILPADAEASWLDPEADPEALRALLAPYPGTDLATREVGDAVNDVRNDGPELLEPPAKLF
jgi:putative SOS response-associated peptidase YedK